MRIRTGEHPDNGHLYAVVSVDGEEWGVVGFLPDFLVQTAGVLKEWRRFNRSVIEHFLRCQEIEFDTISHDGESENDPIKFDDSSDDDGV